MYDPVTARFLQEDTYSGDPSDPLSLNLYTYCKNEPLMHYDPTGHITVTASNGMMVTFEPSVAQDRKYIKYVMAATQSKAARNITKESYYVASYYMGTKQFAEFSSDYPELSLAVYNQVHGEDLFGKKQMRQMGIDVGLYNKKVSELSEVKGIINNELSYIIKRFNNRMGDNARRFGQGWESFFTQLAERPYGKLEEEYNKMRSAIFDLATTPTLDIIYGGLDAYDNWMDNFNNADLYTQIDIIADGSWFGIEQLIYAGATYGIGEGVTAEKNIAKYLDELKTGDAYGYVKNGSGTPIIEGTGNTIIGGKKIIKTEGNVIHLEDGTKLYSNRYGFEDFSKTNIKNLEIKNINGKYKDYRGYTANKEYIYAIDENNNLIMSYNDDVIHHSDLVKGGNVKYAGVLKFKNGKLEYWNNNSGHYKPLSEDAGNIVDIMRQNGITDASTENFIGINK
jgi:hypothetical protein